MRASRILILAWMFLGCSGAADAAFLQKGLVVWLIPSEPATPDAGIGGTADCENEPNQNETLPQKIQEEIELFNQEMAQTRVTVINTQNPFKAQLVDWSPEMAVPNWVWVRSQRATVSALAAFANAHHVNVRVRFITWDRALSELTATWEGHNSYEPPDVVQIGSTWAGYFQDRDLLLRKTDGSRQGWLDLGGRRGSVLPYVNDAHVLFYWKRLPGAPESSPGFEMNSDSWKTILESLRRAQDGGPPLVFPIGLTLNLLHDYAPLVWAGGGALLPQQFGLGSRLDLTSPEAFSVPKYLATNAVVQDRGHPRRLIAFPEASHEEAARSFVRGLYRATLEPANFIGRWRRDFNCRYLSGRPPETFWKYAGVALPPTPFRGGSYLAVWAHTALPGAAVDLAEFLTTDEAYTRMLGVSGYLPARRPGGGVDLFLGNPDSSPEAHDFAVLVQQALDPKVGRSYPPIPEFSRVLESREMLERLQSAWRRMSEGDPVALRNALGEVETHVNRQIYLPSRYYNSFVDISSVVAPALAALLLLLYLMNRRRILALRQIARVRGFSAAGALLFETVHGVFRNPSASAGTGPREATKQAMILAALQGWRRGRDRANWKSAPLGDVIWRSIVLAFDSSICLGIFKEWEAGHTPPWEFLQSWLDDPRAGSARALTIEVTYSPNEQIHMPFMLEQALVCLLQNALKILLHPDFQEDLPRLISICAEDNKLVLWNPGPPLGLGLCEAINRSQSPEEFEQRIAELLTHPGAGTPGFGLVESYCVLSQCFEGMRVQYDEPRFELRLRRPRLWRRAWMKLQRRGTVTFHISAKGNSSEASSQ